jgi:DNA modification methylase
MTFRIINADVLEGLRQLPDESVQCVVTSPPYWRQRDYGIPEQIGLERTPDEYCSRMVEVFRDVRRVLSADGSLWLNLGDKWASGGNGGGGSFMEQRSDAWSHAKESKGWRKPPVGYKDKDLVGIPWMVAFALRADGWYLRQCNVWAKPNCMPESVRDRSTISHEYVFQLTKSTDYFYDTDAARTPAQPSSETRLSQDVESQTGSLRANGGEKSNGPMKAVARSTDKQRGHSRRHDGFNDRWDAMEKSEQQASGANLRSVWWISPAQYGDNHYAVMPERVAEICCVCGSREGDTVLDPFCGAGTTGVVALRYNRNFVGIELNPEYAAMAERRITDDAPLLNAMAQ